MVKYAIPFLSVVLMYFTLFEPKMNIIRLLDKIFPFASFKVIL